MDEICQNCIHLISDARFIDGRLNVCSFDPPNGVLSAHNFSYFRERFHNSRIESLLVHFAGFYDADKIPKHCLYKMEREMIHQKIEC